MTKTLTEQWYDDTIDRSHHYYVRIKGKEEMGCGGIDFIDIIRPPLFRDQVDKLLQYNDPEVLSLVPSYDEYMELLRKTEQLEKKLAIATKALKEIEEYTKEYSLPSYTGMRCWKALKEMEGLK